MSRISVGLVQGQVSFFELKLCLNWYTKRAYLATDCFYLLIDSSNRMINLEFVLGDFTYSVLKSYSLVRHGGIHLHSWTLRRLRQEDPKFQASLNKTLSAGLSGEIDYVHLIICTYSYLLPLLYPKNTVNQNSQMNGVELTCMFPICLYIYILILNSNFD